MTGRQRMEAAFSKDGTGEIPAVICYDGIFIRDHWSEITPYPWWYQYSPDIGHHTRWILEAANRLGLDWFATPEFMTAEDRININLEFCGEEVYQADKRTGERKKIARPVTGGKHRNLNPETIPETPEDIDRHLGALPVFNAESFKKSGRNDLAEMLVNGCANHLFPFCYQLSPLWCSYYMWGFEEAMVKIKNESELVKYACERYLERGVQNVRKARTMGASGIWIEECLTDIICPEMYKTLSLPYVKQLTDEIRDLGMSSIYYFAGNPCGKLDLILSAGADAVAFEESKKGFTIDIEDIVDAVSGRCTVFGNLDSVNILENGTEEQLREEVKRQLTAGRKNKNRFVMSTGSPPTPGTPPDRVRLYCDLVHGKLCRIK